MKFGYSMPPASPLYPEPPFCYKGNRVISIVFRTTPEALQGLVPAPLLPNPDHLAFIYVGEFNVDSPVKANYREAGIGVPALFGETLGSYFAYLYLDPPLAIVPGREIWGFPKKDASIAFTREGALFRATVSRDGVTLVSASVNASERVEPVPDEPGLPAFNLKLIPSVKRSSPPDVLQLTSATVMSERRELYRGAGTLSLASSSADDLARLPVLEIVGGEQYIEDMTLDSGDVLFDYLTESKP